jgi:hypothetical protein
MRLIANFVPVERRSRWFARNASCAGVSILFFSLMTVSASAQISNATFLAWNAPGTGTFLYRVAIGTNSGSYQKQLTFTSTNGWLDASSLFPGTNFVAVAALADVSPTNGLWSPYSSEIQIVRMPASTMTITGAILGASNLVKAAWGPVGTFQLAVAGNQPQGFFLPVLTGIRKTPDNITLPPLP